MTLIESTAAHFDLLGGFDVDGVAADHGGDFVRAEGAVLQAEEEGVLLGEDGGGVGARVQGQRFAFGGRFHVVELALVLVFLVVRCLGEFAEIGLFALLRGLHGLGHALVGVLGDAVHERGVEGGGHLRHQAMERLDGGVDELDALLGRFDSGADGAGRDGGGEGVGLRLRIFEGGVLLLEVGFRVGDLLFRLFARGEVVVLLGFFDLLFRCRLLLLGSEGGEVLVRVERALGRLAPIDQILGELLPFGPVAHGMGLAAEADDVVGADVDLLVAEARVVVADAGEDAVGDGGRIADGADEDALLGAVGGTDLEHVLLGVLIAHAYLESSLLVVESEGRLIDGDNRLFRVGRVDGAVGLRVGNRAGDDRAIGVAVHAGDDHLRPRLQRYVHASVGAAAGLGHAQRARCLGGLAIGDAVVHERHAVAAVIVERAVLGLAAVLDQTGDDARHHRLGGDARGTVGRAHRNGAEVAVILLALVIPSAEGRLLDVMRDLDEEELADAAVGMVLDGDGSPRLELGYLSTAVEVEVLHRHLLSTKGCGGVGLVRRLEVITVLVGHAAPERLDLGLAEEIHRRIAVVVVAGLEVGGDETPRRLHFEHVLSVAAGREGHRVGIDLQEAVVAVGEDDDLRLRVAILLEIERDAVVLAEPGDEGEIRLLILDDELTGRVFTHDAEVHVRVGEAGVFELLLDDVLDRHLLVDVGGERQGRPPHARHEPKDVLAVPGLGEAPVAHSGEDAVDASDFGGLGAICAHPPEHETCHRAQEGAVIQALRLVADQVNVELVELVDVLPPVKKTNPNVVWIRDRTRLQVDENIVPHVRPPGVFLTWTRGRPYETSPCPGHSA